MQIDGELTERHCVGALEEDRLGDESRRLREIVGEGRNRHQPEPVRRRRGNAESAEMESIRDPAHEESQQRQGGDGEEDV